MNESDTRLKRITPALERAGWGKVANSQIFTEQRAYQISPGRIEKVGRRNPKFIDYLLSYRGQKLAIVEAKSDEKDVSAGVPQAKLYAAMMNIRFTYSTNGNEKWAIDMKTGKEGFVDRFPTPEELWQMTFPETNEWRDKLNAIPFNRDGGKQPRYYQEIATNKVMEAVANEQKRILLTLATGTGKTYLAFQIVWKLFKARWNVKKEDRIPRILFLADRNILADQALNDFGQFPEDAMCRLTPDEISKTGGKVPLSRSLYFTIFQTFMSGETPYYKQYPQDFFDFIIIDECHRGGANDESQWREIMEYFSSAYQLGLTATPKREVNADTYRYFGEPVYIYSLKQGIEDGFLTPFRVRIGSGSLDEYMFKKGDKVVVGEIEEDKVYTETDFYQGNIYIRERDEDRVKEFLKQIKPDDKTLVFCATQNHAAQVRDMISQHSKNPHPMYCVRVTANDGKLGEGNLGLFQNNERTLPTILTTSQKLTTGVDARNVRNIVLMRPVNNIIEFKQIVGRGTRVYDEKFYFTIYDFVKASEHFADPEWDGEPIEPTIVEEPEPKGGEGDDDKPKPRPMPQPCPVCGNMTCTCPGGKPKKTVVVKLSEERTVELRTEWEEKFLFDGKLIGMDEFIKILFGNLPRFFKSDQDLREQWANPDTRKALLTQLEREGFALEKLRQVQYLLDAEDCDLLDVLEFLAYHSTPMERRQRVNLVYMDIMESLTEEQVEFAKYVLNHYIARGSMELYRDNLPHFLRKKYGSTADAVKKLGNPQTISSLYLNLQQTLYAV